MKLTNEIIRGISGTKSERSIAFYDAIMAIAITLMVLDMDMTQFRQFNWSALKTLFIPFTALVISFVLLAEVWIFHVRIYSLPYMHEKCSPQMSACTLFFVCMFPKTTEVIAKYSEHFWSILVYVVGVVGVVGLTVLSIRLSLGHASQDFFADTRVEQNNRLRVFPKDLPDVVHALSNYAELRETYDTLKRYFRLNLWELVAMILTTLGSTVCIMFAPGACYIFLVINIAVNAVLRVKINRIDLDEFMDEFDIFTERIEDVYDHADMWRDSSGRADFDAEAAQLAIEEDWHGDHLSKRERRQKERQLERRQRKSQHRHKPGN